MTSFDALVRLRQRRMVPEFLWVLVGNPPRYLPQGAACVHVRPGERPEDLDWRPVVGLNVVTFEVKEGRALLPRVCRAIDAARPRSHALACSAGTVALTPAHEQLLRKARVILCR